jgi:hypothetical protein
MGRVKHSSVSGKVANLIYYEFRGKSCCRSAPATVRQTAGMKKSASQFGLASRASRYLRKGLTPVLPDEKDKVILYGFNNAILKWLKELQPDENTFSADNFFIDNFQLNQNALLPILVKKPVHTSFSNTGNISIKIPALKPGKDMLAPAGTIRIHFRAQVTACRLDFKDSSCYQVERQRGDKRSAGIVLDYANQPLPSQTLSLHIEQEKSALTVVVLRLQYEVKKNGKLQMVTDKRWMPAGIVGSCFGVRGGVGK